MHLSVIGAGAVGMAWIRAVLKVDIIDRLSVFDPFPGPLAKEWESQTGRTIETLNADARLGDLVLLCVPGDLLPSVVDQALPGMATASCLVDLSTAAPDAKRAAAARARGRGVGYVDVAITGAVALTGARTPLLVAGESDERWARTAEAVGAPVTQLEGAEPGDAVRVKLLRSVITKGIEALAVEMLPAARHMGVMHQVFSVFDDIDRKPFADLVRSMVTTHGTQAERRAHEVDEAVTQLEDLGFAAPLTRAVAERYRISAEQLAVSDPADEARDFDTVLDRVTGPTAGR